MNLWSVIKRKLAPRRIVTLAGLRDFLESRSAYLAQKSIMEYSQARAPLLFSTLLSEKGFLDAYERARWASYPAAFAMTAEAVEAALRPLAGDGAGKLRGEIERLGREVFASFPLPDGVPPRFWMEAAQRLSRDLALAGLAEPRPPHRVVAPKAAEIFAVLPAHASLRAGDFEMFTNTLKLHLTEIVEEFERRADAPALVREALDNPRSHPL